MSHWAVVQTEAQREHAVRLLLMRRRYETYMPRTRTRSGRVSLLFPTYVFARIVDVWYPILWTPHVIRLLMSGERPAQLPEVIVSNLRKQERGGFVKLPAAVRLRRGQPVRIIRGSMEGRIGLYDGQTSRDRERVLLDLLGRQVPVELPARDLMPMSHNILRNR